MLRRSGLAWSLAISAQIVVGAGPITTTPGNPYAPNLILTPDTQIEATILRVDDGGTLASPKATELNIFTYRASASDYEGLRIMALPGNKFRLNVVATGNGVQRDLEVASSGTAAWWFGLDLPGFPFHPDTNNTNDLGIPNQRIRTGYFATSVVSPLYVAGSTNGLTASCAPTTITVIGGIVTAMTGGTC